MTSVTANQPAATNQIIDKLRSKAKNDPIFKTICEIFANRQRARGQVTVASLKQTTDKTGHSFERADIAEVIKFLASAHVGRLDRNARGRVRALKDVKWTLQSVGNAALTGEALHEFKMKKQKTYRALSVRARTAVVADKSTASTSGGMLTLNIDGKMVDFPIYRKISKEEVGFILADLYGGSYGKNNT